MKGVFFKKGDIIVYLAAFVIFVAAVLLFLIPKNADFKSIDIVDFSKGNTLLARYDVRLDELSVYSERVSVKKEDGSYIITVITDGKENTVKIANGKAKMISANCSHSADCTKFEEISGAGDEIVCLPNKLIIRGIGDGNRLVVG